MNREEMINYIIEIEGDKERVLLLTKPMNDTQIEKMYEAMVQQQMDYVDELVFA